VTDGWYAQKKQPEWAFSGFRNQATYITFANPKERLLWLLAFAGITGGNFFVEIYCADQ
jgi:hypothetical protein